MKKFLLKTEQVYNRRKERISERKLTQKNILMKKLKRDIDQIKYLRVIQEEFELIFGI